MASLKFDREITALIVIDPYNDFISEGGKIWPRIKIVAKEVVEALSSANVAINAEEKLSGTGGVMLLGEFAERRLLTGTHNARRSQS